MEGEVRCQQNPEALHFSLRSFKTRKKAPLMSDKSGKKQCTIWIDEKKSQADTARHM